MTAPRVPAMIEAMKFAILAAACAVESGNAALNAD